MGHWPWAAILIPPMTLSTPLLPKTRRQWSYWLADDIGLSSEVEIWGNFTICTWKIVSLIRFLSVDPIATLQVKREESSSSSPSHKTRCFYKRSQMNCEEGETNINGINNDSIVGQSASKIDPTQCAVMSGEKWMPRKFHCKILVGVKANSWRFCLHLPLSLLLLSFSFSLSPQFLSDRTKTILPFPPTRFQADR